MMISFWKTMNSDKKTYWNYLFFAALGLGLLAKGPLIMVLTFPLFIWCCLSQLVLKRFSKFSVLIGLNYSVIADGTILQKKKHRF
jgi:4-amino-4-deoxy-L-arabinose transferase-like glycosyltransferase